MNPIAKNVLVAILGFVIGSFVNMALINIGMHVVPLPEGADVSTMEGLRESMKLFTPMNFVFPFLAHAIGTLTGAFVTVKLVTTHHMKFTIGISVAFLMGGVAAASILGGPVWFIACDLLLAYIPMGILGGFLGSGKKPQPA
ncbi:MAG: hypothetical protein AABZ60_07810 [Planctomycetota bacterium]